MKDVCFVKHSLKFSWLCHIESFSGELKKEIRARLSSICHGEKSADNAAKIYSYKETLKEFIKRYDQKSEETKKGMIGELLSHIIILKEFPHLQSACPYFNMEEGSIKKGFDLLLFDNECNSIWITEVKSGEANTKKSDSKNISLLNTAKNDLYTRLNEQNTTIWLNALNGANIALKSGNVKTSINNILEKISDDVVEGNAKSNDKDVILISVLFKSLNDKITLKKIELKRKKILQEDLFGNFIVCSMQKQTYQKVINFLKSEANK